MHEIKEILKKYNIKALSYEKNNNYCIIKDKNTKYIVVKDNINIDIYNLLKARNFPYILDINNGYSIKEFKEIYNLSNYEKAKDIAYILSMLHIKTTHYENINNTYYKKIYENILNDIEIIEDFFTNINDFIFEDDYLSPSMYLLIRNISKIYSLIEYLKEKLDNWYENVSKESRIRVSVINNNLSLESIIKLDNNYIINWNNSKIDLPIYDLVKLYKNTYDKVDFSNLLDIYLSKYPLNKNEIELLLILLSIPDGVTFGDDEYKNVCKVNKLYDYIYKTDDLVSKYYSKYKKEENNDFDKEQNSIPS